MCSSLLWCLSTIGNFQRLYLSSIFNFNTHVLRGFLTRGLAGYSTSVHQCGRTSRQRQQSAIRLTCVLFAVGIASTNFVVCVQQFSLVSVVLEWLFRVWINLVSKTLIQLTCLHLGATPRVPTRMVHRVFNQRSSQLPMTYHCNHGWGTYFKTAWSASLDMQRDGKFKKVRICKDYKGFGTSAFGSAGP